MFRDDVDMNDPAAIRRYREEVLAMVAAGCPQPDLYLGLADTLEYFEKHLKPLPLGNPPADGPDAEYGPDAA